MLARFDPFRDFSLRREIERLFDQSLFRREFPSFEFSDVASMPLDVFEEGNNIVVKASIPGLKPEEIKVEVRGDVLCIWGETKQKEEKKERNYHLKEHRYSRYERSVRLPCEVQTDKADANFDNGLLTLTLLKSEASQTKTIPIKTLAKV